MPETSQQMLQCGTKAPGWLKGVHPHREGKTKNTTVCFSYDYGGHPEYDCDRHTERY